MATDDLTPEERAFFASIDANFQFEAEVFDQVKQFADEQYYTLQQIHARHVCGFATIKVYAERAGTLYQCTNCGQAGNIGN